MNNYLKHGLNNVKNYTIITSINVLTIGTPNKLIT